MLWYLQFCDKGNFEGKKESCKNKMWAIIFGPWDIFLLYNMRNGWPETNNREKVLLWGKKFFFRLAFINW